jgi:hypothetical protein
VTGGGIGIRTGPAGFFSESPGATPDSLVTRHAQLGNEGMAEGQQPFDSRIVHRALGDLLVQYGQILAQSVEFAQVPHDRGRFVLRQDLPS